MDTLVDRIKAAAARVKPGPKGFEGRLPQDIREQLLEIRRQFQAGELNVSAVWLADQIVAMAAADGFLFPSWSEALALVEVEAAACGLPLFLTPHHGSEMVLRDGLNGRRLEFDADAIARVLTEFVTDVWQPVPVQLECGLDRATFAQRFTSVLVDACESRVETQS